nr:MAG TPA: hypothetical protein [Caudoviricetes sp.]
MKFVEQAKDYIHDNRYKIAIGALIGVSLVACKEVYSLGKLVGAHKGFDSAIGAICDINPELAVQIAEEAIKQGKKIVTCKL